MKTNTMRSFNDNFRMIRTCLPLAIVSASLLMGCSGSDAASTPTQEPGGPMQKEPQAQPVAIFKAEKSCPVALPEGVSARCGKLEVPEDYAKPDGRKIQLQVAIFESTSEAPAKDPVVYLSGGPGAGAVSGLATVATGLGPLLAERDVIAIDQRGTGFSSPALTCFELDAVTDAFGAISAITACHDHFAEQGTNLGQYNTENNARDVLALRKALGLSKIDVLGTSYGTRLALELMRQEPEGLRAVALDSTLAPDVDALAETASAAERSFNQVFAACADDPMCSAAFPDLEQRFYQVVAALNDKPLMVKHGDEQVALSGTRLVELTGTLLYDMNGILLIPSIIAEAEGGATTSIEQFGLLDASADAGVAVGMNLSVVCAEYAPLTSSAKIAAAEAEVRPEIASVWNSQKYLVACPIWSVPPAPASMSKPVTSDVTTLLLSGSFDPSTPPSWSDHVAETLPHAHQTSIASATHGVVLTECGMLTLATFLHDPDHFANPDCVAQSSSHIWSQAAAAQQ